jgi:hypothetical protein
MTLTNSLPFETAVYTGRINDCSVVRKKLITSETVQAQFSLCIGGTSPKEKTQSSESGYGRRIYGQPAAMLDFLRGMGLTVSFELIRWMNQS